MRHALLALLAVFAACDASSSFTFRAAVRAPKGTYALEADGVALTPTTPEGSSSTDEFIVEHDYPSYSAALSAPPIEVVIFDRAGTRLGSDTVAPSECSYICTGTCDLRSLDLEDRSFNIQADYTLMEEGCVTCVSGRGFRSICP